jgi:hypothetical protein
MKKESLMTDAKCESNERPRIVLTSKIARDIFQIKATHGFASLHRASLRLASKYGVSSKAIRDIWKGRSWLDATYDLWNDADRPARKIIGRPKGKKDSKPRVRGSKLFRDSESPPPLDTAELLLSNRLCDRPNCDASALRPQQFPTPMHDHREFPVFTDFKREPFPPMCGGSPSILPNLSCLLSAFPCSSLPSTRIPPPLPLMTSHLLHQLGSRLSFYDAPWLHAAAAPLFLPPISTNALAWPLPAIAAWSG